ncbi:MAG: EamA family transporter, partial [Pseudoclavibacter sp.]
MSTTSPGRSRVAGAVNRVPAWSLAVVAMLGIQLSNALSVSVIEVIGAGGTTFLRMLFGAIFLIAIARPSLRRIRRHDIPALLALGTVTGLMTTMFLSAAERIPLGTAVSIEFLGPLTVAAVLSKRAKALVWPLVALAGVVLLSEPWSGTIDLVGVGFALLAAVCWAGYNLLTQRVGDRFEGITGLAMTIPVAAVVTALFGVPQISSSEWQWWVVPAVAGIALITPVFSFGLEMLALKRMTQTAFGTLLSIEPAFGVLIGLLVLAQQPTWLQLVGVALVIVAGAAAQRGGAWAPGAAGVAGSGAAG